ncbi:MAG: hypothetical protein R2939_18115 [Kofleriaceae bacterium]
MHTRGAQVGAVTALGADGVARWRRTSTARSTPAASPAPFAW